MSPFANPLCAHSAAAVSAPAAALSQEVLSFREWLAELSLDAARTDLCPNLSWIPLEQLWQSYEQGCPPLGSALSKGNS